jgi:hypothetical protein
MSREPNRHARAASVALPALLLCLACGDSNKVEVRLPPAREVVPEEQTPDEDVPTPGEGNATDAEASPIEDLLSADVLSIDPLAREVADILRARCSACHGPNRANGGIGDLSDMAQDRDEGLIVPGSSATSPLVLQMNHATLTSPASQPGPANRGEIALVSRFIDRLPATPSAACAEPTFQSLDAVYATLLADVQRVPAPDRPFTRYVGLTYASNAGSCGAALERQRSALFKLVNSVSRAPDIRVPLSIDSQGTLYRIDIRDYAWDRDIDLEDNGSAEFADAWLALTAAAGPYAIELEGPDADALKTETTATVPYLPAHTLVHAASAGNLYYALVGVRGNIEQTLSDLGVPWLYDDPDPLLKNAGFSVGRPRNRESIVSRTEQATPGRAYWSIGDGYMLGHTSIFIDPLDTYSAAQRIIFHLPNGLQAYAILDWDGYTRAETLVPNCGFQSCDPLRTAPPTPLTLADCHACHEAGLVPVLDQIRTVTEENPNYFDRETYDEVMRTFVAPAEFDQVLQEDTQLHLHAASQAGVRSDGPEPISLVHYQFERDVLSARRVAAELAATPEALNAVLPQLDARLGVLATADGRIDRSMLTNVYVGALCALHKDSRNRPAHCP